MLNHPKTTAFLTFLILYIVGIFFLPKEQPLDVMERETFYYLDSEGDEHEAQTLIQIEGVGPVFTYKDVYFLTTSIIFIISIISCAPTGDSKRVFHDVNFSLIVIGIMLFHLSNKDSRIPTILFWIGLIAEYIIVSLLSRRHQSNT